jgi:hypothetical protein
VRWAFRAAAWMLLTLAVLAVAVIVPAGALRAHGTAEFNRWASLATSSHSQLCGISGAALDLELAGEGYVVGV